MNKQNLQDHYLEQLQHQEVLVSIYLINGIKLSGVVASFDQYVVLLKDNKILFVIKTYKFIRYFLNFNFIHLPISF